MLDTLKPTLTGRLSRLRKGGSFVMPAQPESGDAASLDSLVEIALHVHRYARRYAVGQSLHPEDAIIYDACMSVLRTEITHRSIGTPDAVGAAADRFQRYGPEPPAGSFSLPVTAEDAVVLLHRFARRYTNGRGTFTAALVNEAANLLLARGVSLSETRDIDGTIWAADGAEGKHDGLTPEQHREALSVLGRD